MGRRRRKSMVAFDEDEEYEVGTRKDDEKQLVVYIGDDEDDGDGFELADESLDEYEDDGFVVNDIEEDEEETQQKEKKTRLKRKSLKPFVLDEDDYELLRENDPSFHQPNMENNKFKRLKKKVARSDREVGAPSGLSDDDDHHDEEEGDGLHIEDEEHKSGDEGDEMEDFIVDEETYYEKRNPMSYIMPIRQKKQKEKKQRQALGRVPSSTLTGGHYLIGDVDELLKLQKQGLAKSDDTGEFDHFILTEKHMAEKDNSILEIDIPERIQISQEVTGPTPFDKFSNEEEISWILSQLATNVIPLFGEKRDTERNDEAFVLVKKINKEDIVRFLKLHYVEKYDIPFIAMYRKEQCLSLLKDLEPEEAENRDEDVFEGTPKLKWHKILWAIKELHKKWFLLQKRKTALLQYYNKHYEEESRKIHDKTRFTSSQLLFESITTSFSNAISEKDMNDVDMKFSLLFPPTEEKGLFRRPKRRSQYDNCTKAGLWKVAKMFGCNSEQFGLQVTLEKVRMDMWEEPKESPDEVASNYTCAMFATPEAVLKGARHMAALEISSEPCFMSYVRSIFMDKALVSTSPTPEGNKAIDSYHLFGKVKWIHEKPLFKFLDAQWLLIQKAEEDKLLQVTIKLPESTLSELKIHSHDCYLGDDLIESGRLWNEQRKLILEDAFSKTLLPSMEKEARNSLTTKAKNLLLMEYGKQLWNRVSVAPYQHKNNNVGFDKDTGVRVMACCWGPGKPETTFVMLNTHGELLDVLFAGSLSLRSQNVIDHQRKKYDQHRLLMFMRNHQPHVIVLGAEHMSSTRLKDDIYEIILKIDEENSGDIGHAMDRIDIIYGDVSLPHLYEHSQISSDQLPGKPDIVKRAVALGRYLQNPLAMVATLCGAGREILNWKLTSLDNFIPSDEKYEMIEQMMVEVTNQVGFDINLAVHHDWLFAPLQFVSGLGPQKAASLKKELTRAKDLENRMELTDRGLRTKNVFHNAVGFLRVCCSELLAIGTNINILDNTRIHPESYCLAEELSKAVHNCYDAPNDTENDVLQEMAYETLRGNLELLKGFDINEYADDYGKEKGENKRETLYDIRAELLHGFQDPRTEYKELTPDEAFHLISGGNRDMLAEGRIIQATVRGVQPRKAICVLEGGLTGILSKDDFSDQRDDFDLKDKLREGDMLACKIKHVEKSNYVVFLSYKESELKSNQSQDFHHDDAYYCEGWNSLLSLQEEDRKEKEVAKNHFNPRMIFHPLFENFTVIKAVEFLSDRDPGECIFHPSLKGTSYLTLTLKVSNGVFAHKDIAEYGKDQKDLTGLGRTLLIGNDAYRNLDEVMERYVQPLVNHLKAMLSSQKFKGGTIAEVDHILRAEKSDYPMRITYCFSISRDHPGTFILSYIRSTKPQHEYIGLHPKGFKFRKHTFENIDQLVTYFQQHINDLQHKPVSLAKSFSPMAPMTGRPLGGSSVGASLGCGRGNDNGRWRSQTTLDKDKSISTPCFRGKSDYKDGGKSDYKDGGCGYRQPSESPGPYGGWGSLINNGDNRGDYRKDSGNGTKKRSLSEGGDLGDNGRINFSDTQEEFGVGWGNGGTGKSDGGNWGGGHKSDSWGGSNLGRGASNGNWSGGQAGGSFSADNRGGNGGLGRGRGRRDCSRGRGRGRDGAEGDDGNLGGGHNSDHWGSSNLGRSASNGNWSGGQAGGNFSADSEGGHGGRGRSRGRDCGQGRGRGRDCGQGRGRGDDCGRGRGRGRDCGRGRGRGRGRDSSFEWGSDTMGEGRGGNKGWSCSDGLVQNPSGGLGSSAIVASSGGTNWGFDEGKGHTTGSWRGGRSGSTYSSRGRSWASAGGSESKWNGGSVGSGGW